MFSRATPLERNRGVARETKIESCAYFLVTITIRNVLTCYVCMYHAIRNNK